ncbi:LacI family DNA-binding transcriptional regulator [Protaetiibacter sp. SSC-01]|uniref:LacI family DNA-binding transcriptional regulator n=1 Tax=Protaetiibacter sp. SSC-01 TaxID=2759943 RepID=UPI001656F4C7|nr:LacI family DNA-binding transcriptional regulator [Protaetiibacter sp. SSC-01]QNO37711.1 LacI family DNA-binding transcriptional regulator [Protaetiibacter sp. SSC-01]
MSASEPSTPGRVTIKEVAERAGVSRSTASRALAGTGYVAEPVRQRVRKAADDLGYVVDATARSLKQRSSRVIGVIVSDLRNAFYADLAFGAGERARRAGYTMLLVDDGGSAEDELEAARAFVASRVAGVVLTPVAGDAVAFLQRQHVPVVEVDRVFGEADAVVIDNRHAAHATTEHLLSLGHRRIALVIDETDWTTGRERRAGFADALDAAGVALDPSLVVAAGWDAEAAERVMTELLSGDDRPTAVFAANNLLAEGVWRAARALGLSIPEQLSIVAFDDAPWMSMVTPGVTAIRQDAAELGRTAVDQLIARIADPQRAPHTVTLPAGFARRASTARPAN